jgi:uncharacterized delta-60 repeat protein
MGRGNRAEAAHRTRRRKYRSGIRSLEDRLALSATPGSADVDDLLNSGPEQDSDPITVQAAGVGDSSTVAASGAASTAAWYSSVSSAWFTTLSTSSLNGGAGAVQTTDGSTGNAGGVNDPTIDAGNYSEWIVRLSTAALETINSVDEAASWLANPSLGLSVIAGLGLPGQLLVRATGAVADIEQFFTASDAFAYFTANRQVGVQATPNDTSYSSLYGLHNTGQTGGNVDADIDAPEAWDISTGSRSIVVGVIDSGIDWTHPDLAANIWTNPGEVAGDGIDNDGNGFVDDVHGYDFVNNDGNPMDDQNHGTHVAGTIGGVGDNGTGVVGVNWAVSMMGLKMFGSDGKGTTANAIRAVNYATMMRTNYGVNVRVTNNSWSGGLFDQGLLDAINAGGAADILFIAAAGNSGRDSDLWTPLPASYNSPYVVSVAATDRNDALADFSNYGATTVDLAAPGVSVYSTLRNGNYGIFSGTSMATPHVAGAAALALSVAPTLSAVQLKNRLLENVDVIPGLAGKTATSGRLNINKVLSSLGLTVASTTPTIGSVLSTPPTSFTLNFSQAYNPATVIASDFKVNGIAADGLTFDDADTITFTFAVSPVTAQGLQTMTVAEGAITRASDGDSLANFSATFRYDALSLAVMSTTPAQTSLVALPLATLDLQFNEAIAGASVGTSDLTISHGTVTGATLLNATTARYTLSGLVNDGTFTFTLAAGAVTDVFGNIGPSYSGSFSLDTGLVALPAATPVGLAGSLVYQTAFTGSIGAAGDEDRLAIAVDAGQRLSVQLDAAAGLTAQIEVRDPSDALVGSATATDAGLDAVLRNLSIAVAGNYTIVVRGVSGSAGAYTVRALLNSDVESENHDGPTNGTIATAQSIEGAMLPLAGSAARASVLGRLMSSSDVDWYSLSLAAGQTLSATLRLLGAGTPTFRLTDAGGAAIATATAASDGLTFEIHGFKATAAGTYYLEVGGATSLDYQLLVGRNVEFDRRGNVGTASAHTLAAASGVVVGNLDVGTSIGRLYVYDANTNRIREIDKNTGATLATFATPVAEASGPDFGMATTPTSLLVGGEGSSPIYELNPNTGTVLRTIGAAGLDVSGLAYRNGEIFVRTDSNNVITVLDYATGNTLRAFTITSSSESLAAASDYLYAGSGNVVYTIDPQTGATVSTKVFSGYTAPIDGLGVIGNELFAAAGSVINVYDRTSFTLLRTLTGQSNLEAIGADGGASTVRDFYRVTLSAGGAFQARTSTPADGGGEFVNRLDARLNLYDLLGNLVATDDNSAPDARNAVLNYTPAAGGTYYLVVEPANPANQITSLGEYVIEYSGAVDSAAPFRVTAVTPANGANVAPGPVSQLTLTFNQGVLLSSLSPADLTVDGTPAAGFTVIDGSTVRFQLATPLTQGTHVVALAAGAVLDLGGTPAAAFFSSFSVDSAAPRVVSSSIQQNQILAAGGLTYVVTFDEAMRQDVDASDFSLRGNFRGVNYAASGFAFDFTGRTLSITYATLPEDSYTLTLASGDGRFEDAGGNDLDGEPVFPVPSNRSGNGAAGGDFVVSFSLDAPTTALPAPIAVAPAGSLVYRSSAPTTVAIGATGDVDELSIALDAGQTLSVVATSSAMLRTTLEILRPDGASIGTATAAFAGQTLVVQTVPVAVAGTYRLRFGGAASSTGLANVSITLNAAVEGESNGGSANNTIASAQSLEASFLALASGARGAVIGKLEGGGSGSATLSADDSGWYDGSGLHAASNTNYAVGNGAPGGDIHNFFVFNLATINDGIVSAQLRLLNPSGGYLSPDSTETFAVFDVSTPISQLVAGGTGLTAVFNDLGTGTQFGSRTVSAADNDQTVAVDLNAAAIAALNEARGGQVALGGALTTLSGTALQYLFGFTSSGYARELFLTYGAPAPDYYSFTLAAGEAATVGLKHLSGSGATITIRDAGGNVLASGAPGTGSFDQVAANFTAPSAGTYYVAVTSPLQATYELVVTRNLAFDDGANGSAATAQNIGANRSVMGHVSTGADDYYSFVVAAPTTLTLSTATPGDGSGQFANTLDPAVELYDALGNLLGANDNGALGGRNALLSRTIAAGTYKARVSATSGQGEYVLEISESATAPPSIATIADLSAREDVSTEVEFTITDADTPAGQMNVTAAAGAASLVPAAGLGLTHLGAGRWRLTITPAENAYGLTSITIQAFDGQSATTRTFTLSVTPVNDAPTFVAGGDLTVDYLAGPQTFAGWATGISQGPNDVGQAAVFLVSNDNPALFAVAPSITPGGTLSFTASGLLGEAVVKVRLRDDGGTADGGVDTSATQTFRITFDNTTFTPAGLDPTFDGDGMKTFDSILGSLDIGRDFARQADGKYVMIASINGGGVTGGFGNSAVMRYNADGTLDTGFGTGGTVQFADNVRLLGVEIKSDGKIVVGGSFNSSIYSARLNSNGSFDSTYGTGGVSTMNVGITGGGATDAAGTALQADGKLLVTRVKNSQAVLARFNANGTTDTTFNGTGSVTFTVPSTTSNLPKDVVVQSDGKIVVVGNLVAANQEFFAIRFNANGTIDATFGAAGNGIVVIGVTTGTDTAARVALQADGKILIGGRTGSGDFALVRLTTGGLLDTTFSGDGMVTTSLGGTEDAFALALQADGRIVLGGSTSTGGIDFAVARYLSDGTLDTSFDGDGTKVFADGTFGDAIHALGIDPDGKIVFAGWSSDAVNGGDAIIGRLRADGSHDASFNAVGFNRIGFGDSSAETTKTLVLPDGRILVGGRFTDNLSGIGGGIRSVVWRLTPDGEIDPTFGNGGYWIGPQSTTNNSVRSMVVDSAGRILVIDGLTRVIRLTPDGLTDTTFNSTASLSTFIPVPSALAVQANGSVVVFGTTLSDLVVGRLTSTGAWDTSFDGDGRMTLDMGGTSEVAGTVAIDGTGKIVVGGQANTTGNFDLAVARLNANGSLDTTFSGDGKFLFNSTAAAGDFLRDLLVYPDGKIVITGQSSAALTFNIVRLSADGTLDASFSDDGVVTHSPTPGNDEIQALSLQADGKLLAVGTGSISSVPQVVVVRYRDDGSIDTSLDNDDGVFATPIGPTRAFVADAALQPDGKLIVVGHGDVVGSRFDAAVLRFSLGTTTSQSPLISPIADRTALAGAVSAPVDFSVSHTSLSPAGLTVTVTSGDTTVLPNENLTLVNLGDGNWRLTAAPSSAGSSLITVRVSDGTLTYVETFVLTAVPPATVAGIFVRGSVWKSSFLGHLDSQAMGHASIAGLGFRITDESQLQSLPWSNIDTITMAFDGPVVVGQSDLTLVGSADAATPPTASGFVWNATDFTATWTFAVPLAMNKYLLRLAPSVLVSGQIAGADIANSLIAAVVEPFEFRFNALPGDIDASAAVAFAEVSRIRSALGLTAASPDFDPRLDWDGSGAISFADFGQARLALGMSLAGLADPVAPPSTGVIALAVESSAVEGTPGPIATATGGAAAATPASPDETPAVEYFAFETVASSALDLSTTAFVQPELVSRSAEILVPAEAIVDRATVLITVEGSRRLERRFEAASETTITATRLVETTEHLLNGHGENPLASRIAAWHRLRRTRSASTVAPSSTPSVGLEIGIDEGT